LLSSTIAKQTRKQTLGTFQPYDVLLFKHFVFQFTYAALQFLPAVKLVSESKLQKHWPNCLEAHPDFSCPIVDGLLQLQ
jgi:hypothetical protein